MKARDRQIARLAVPALGSLAIEPLYVLVDTAIVGRLGTAPLGGLALASTVLLVGFWVFNFLAYGITGRVAFLAGRGDDRAAARVAAQGLWAAVGIGLVATVLLLVGGGWLLTVLGGRGDVLGHGWTYLSISAWGVPFVLVGLVGHGYLRGMQDTRTPLVVAAVANVLNLVVELWLVFGLDMGIAGSAWSTVGAQGVAAAWFAAILIRRIVTTGAGAGVHRREMLRLATAGRHLVVRTGALLAALTIATAVAARMGPATLAAHQIAFQVMTFLALTVDALAIAGQALTGKHLGAGDAQEARTTAGRLLAIGLVAGTLLAALLLATAGVLPRVFTPDPSVAAAATTALVIVGILQVPASATFVLDGVLIGASDLRFLQWGTLAALVVFGPAAWALLYLPGAGIGALWAALVVWMVVRLVVNGLRFRGDGWVRATAGSP